MTRVVWMTSLSVPSPPARRRHEGSTWPFCGGALTKCLQVMRSPKSGPTEAKGNVLGSSGGLKVTQVQVPQESSGF